MSKKKSNNATGEWTKESKREQKGKPNLHTWVCSDSHWLFGEYK